MSDEIAIVITAEDKASAQLKNVQNSLAGLRSESEKLKDARGMFADDAMAQNASKAAAANQGLIGSLGTMRTAFLALGVTEVVGHMRSMVEESARLDDALKRLNGASIASARELSRGMVPAIDLVTARARLMEAGLELTDAQFEAVVARGTLFAQSMGQDAASGINQLTGALVSGNERGLRPFGFSLQETADRAGLQSQALEQLTNSLDENRRKVEESRGAFDMLKGIVEDVNIDLGSLLRTMYDDGPAVFARNLGNLANVLSGSQSVSEASREAQERTEGLVLEFTRGTPVIGALAQGAVNLGQRFRQAAEGAGILSRAIANIPAPPESVRALMQSTFRRGGATLGPGEQEGGVTISYDDEGRVVRTRRPRNRVEWMRQNYPDDPTGARLTREQNDAISEALSQEQRGGGGGGGGGRDDADDGLDRFERARREIDRIQREQAARDRAESERQWGAGGEYQQELARDPRSRRAWWEGGWNQQGASNSERRGALGREGQERAARGMTNAVERQQTAYERLGERGEAVLSSLNSAWESHFAAFSKGEESFGKAMRGMATAALESLALQSLKEAGFQTAKGIAALASFNYGGAGLHFAAAAAFGLVAGGAYAGSAAIAPASSSARSGGSEFRTPTSSTSLGQRSANDGGGPPINIYLSPGAIVGVGGGDQHAAGNWLADQIEGAHLRRNRQRRIRDAA